VISVEIVDEAARSARVTVPDFQLSLAIGKEGQNARLAARMTGWRIDIRSDNPAPSPRPAEAAPEMPAPEMPEAAVGAAAADADGGTSS
jgi:N utilization substance protein A